MLPKSDIVITFEVNTVQPRRQKRPALNCARTVQYWALESAIRPALPLCRQPCAGMGNSGPAAAPLKMFQAATGASLCPAGTEKLNRAALTRPGKGPGQYHDLDWSIVVMLTQLKIERRAETPLPRPFLANRKARNPAM